MVASRDHAKDESDCISDEISSENKTLINVVPKIISMLSMYVSLESSMKTYFGARLWRGRCRIRVLSVRLLKIRRMLLFHIK
jgi:hypothetical protein